jgi:hypothetical protein
VWRYYGRINQASRSDRESLCGRIPEGPLFVLDATLARVTQEDEYSPILKKQTDGSRIRQPLGRWNDPNVVGAESWYCQAGTPRPFCVRT